MVERVLVISVHQLFTDILLTSSVWLLCSSLTPGFIYFLSPSLPPSLPLSVYASTPLFFLPLSPFHSLNSLLSLPIFFFLTLFFILTSALLSISNSLSQYPLLSLLTICLSISLPPLPSSPPLSSPVPLSLVQVRVGAEVSDVQLVQLSPNTGYTVSIFALHGEAASNPLTDTGVTCTSAPSSPCAFGVLLTEIA